MTRNIFIAYGFLFAATALNAVAVYAVKKSAGFTIPVPSIVALLCICFTQILFGKSMQYGLDVGFSAALLSVCVIGAAIAMGVFFFNETISTIKLCGMILAVTGIVIASIAK